MKKNLYILTGILIIIMNFSLVQANFVCGTVNDSEEISSVWMEAIVYYEENPENTTKCQINPQKKFCCDLDKLGKDSYKPGKKVIAEVFDNETKSVAGPVYIEMSSEGYDILPEMQIKKAIEIKGLNKTILIQKDSLDLNISLAKNYNNLKYIINSQETDVCQDCNYSNLTLQLQKGKNEIEFIAYNGDRQISEKRTIYLLDYFDIEKEFICEKCKEDKVPYNTEAELVIKINSSHEISLELEEHYPNTWNYSGDFEKISDTHNKIIKKVEGKNIEENLVFTSPSVFIPKKYLFKTKIGGITNEKEANVYRFFGWFFFKAEKSKEKFMKSSLVSPDKPLVLNPSEEFIDIIAIYPRESVFIKNQEKIKEKLFRDQKEIEIKTNIPEKQIEKIYLRIKKEKDSEKNIFDKEGNSLNLDFLKDKGNYEYYEGYVDSLEFLIK